MLLLKTHDQHIFLPLEGDLFCLVAESQLCIFCVSFPMLFAAKEIA